jgi:hypothetical protein
MSEVSGAGPVIRIVRLIHTHASIPSIRLWKPYRLRVVYSRSPRRSTDRHSIVHFSPANDLRSLWYCMPRQRDSFSFEPWSGHKRGYCIHGRHWVVLTCHRRTSDLSQTTEEDMRYPAEQSLQRMARVRHYSNAHTTGSPSLSSCRHGRISE